MLKQNLKVRLKCKEFRKEVEPFHILPGIYMYYKVCNFWTTLPLTVERFNTFRGSLWITKAFGTGEGEGKWLKNLIDGQKASHYFFSWNSVQRWRTLNKILHLFSRKIHDVRKGLRCCRLLRTIIIIQKIKILRTMMRHLVPKSQGTNSPSLPSHQVFTYQ